MTAKMQVVNAVRHALDEVAARSESRSWSDSCWTREVKTALCAACRTACAGTTKHRVKLFANGVDCAVEAGEWLFDVTCLLYDETTGSLRRTLLVAESEWGDKAAVADDFEKLLIARADVRTMVLDRGYWQPNEDAVDDLAGYVNAYDGTEPNDLYLLAAWDPPGFEYWLIRGNGSKRKLPRR